MAEIICERIKSYVRVSSESDYNRAELHVKKSFAKNKVYDEKDQTCIECERCR